MELPPKLGMIGKEDHKKSEVRYEANGPYTWGSRIYDDDHCWYTGYNPGSRVAGRDNGKRKAAGHSAAKKKRGKDGKQTRREKG